MAEKIKVLQVTNLLPSQDNVAYGTFIKEQIESLERAGIDSRVVYINANLKGKLEYLKKVKEIKKQAKHCDIIHCHHTYTGFITLFLARTGKPVLTSFLCPGGREGKSASFYLLKKAVYDYVLKKSAAVIIKNAPQCELKYPCRGFYVPNGVDLEFFNRIDRKEALKKIASDPKKKYVLFCASANFHRREKRYDIFKQSINILRDKYDPDVDELLLIDIPREMVPYYFNASRVHLLTSEFEGSPNSVKEALACDVPVVSTRVGDVERLLGGIDGCYISGSNNAEKLAILVHKALQHERVQGRRRLVKLGLDMKSTAEKIKKIYESILAEDLFIMKL